MQRELHLSDQDMDRWRFTVVTREPVDRFLSGFIDRCIRALEYAFDDKFSLLKPSLTLEDLHIFPLNWRCNMEEFYGKYEFIRYSNDPSGTLLADLKPLLQRQNVTESSINYIAESLQSGRTAHSTVTSSARTYFEKRIRSSPYLMELIVRLFYNDYKLFKYDLPDLDMLPVRLPQD
ncbi:hypothetical protein NECAME_06964 [Necator americanus]|uniref:Carbohydrate sulfotransferase n=1 Tax=Necator americanus TaxID=51031 RepID=W2TQ66_NECAM|nr:hypothetical protein NECAME_06964 [Necator americanus]ETN84220.1 hypothetical protein NECAME_06964 [Necator americanus]